MTDHLNKSIDELEMSCRTHNCFSNLGIRTVADIVAFSERQLLRTPNFGRKSLNETKEILDSIGLRLAPELRSDAELLASLLGRFHATKAAYEQAEAELHAYARSRYGPAA